MKKLVNILGAAAILASLFSCKKIDTGTSSDLVRTKEATDLTATSVTLNGHISSSVEEFSGACFIYDKAGALKTASSPRVDGVVDDHDFSAELKDLNSGTDYEYVACAVINGKEVYGAKKTFSTPAIAVSSIRVEPAAVELIFGRSESVQLKAVVSPPEATDPSVTWSSSAPEVATVSDQGLVTAVSVGNAVITAQSTNGDKKGTCQVKVSNVEVTDIELNPTSAVIRTFQGKTCQLTATVKPVDAADKTLTWTSDDTGIATVSSSGLVTAVSTGQTTIRVKSSSNNWVYKTCTVRVYFPPEAVDLGLPVKWAKTNIFASSPEQKGTFNTWGWVEGCTWVAYGGDQTTLPMSYDAARDCFGGTWRLPTRAEMQELSNTSNCTWTWGAQNGVNGYTIKGKNGNSIFLPVTGGYYNYQWYNTKNGYYWTSTRQNSSTDYPQVLVIGESGWHQVYESQTFLRSTYKAFYRPVCSK